MVRTERVNGNRTSKKAVHVGAQSKGPGHIIGSTPVNDPAGEQSWKRLFVMLEHEMRTPLAAALMQLSVVELAMRSGGPSLERAQGMLYGARRQIVGLLQILRRMMEIQTQGQIDLHRETVDLARLATDLVERARSTNRTTWSRVEIASAEAVVGSWDPSALEQILQNLLSNALKFSKGAPVKLTVSATRGGGARIEVQDHGIGIAAQDQERIFGLFQRTDCAQAIAGQGIGLWVVHRLVQAHNGRIEIRSEEGAGATFVVWLPGPSKRAPARAPEPDAARFPARSSLRPRSSARRTGDWTAASLPDAV
jgi:signal transduction histidine kinase